MILSRTTNVLGAAFRRSIILTGSLMAAALTLQAQQTVQPKISEHGAVGGDTASCLKEAAQMNAATIKFGRLAAQKGQNSDLKEFGALIEKDHSKAQGKLEAIAKTHDVVLPTSLDAKCQEELTKLQGLSGSEFDKEFAKGAVQGHATAIAHLQKGASEVKDSELAQYSKEMLTKMKRHQEKAREVAKAVGLDQATIAALETQPPEGVGSSGGNSQTERGSDQKSDQLDRKDAAPQR